MESQLPKFLQDLDPNIFLGDNYVCLDFETTNLDKGSAFVDGNKLVLATWVVGSGHCRSSEYGAAVQFLYAGEYEQARLVEDISSASFIVAQNAKFELQWLGRIGLDLRTVLAFDTMLAEYVRLGNRQGRKDLDSLARRYGLGQKVSLVKELIEGGVCPSEIPSNWLIEYGCKDTELTEQIFLRQRQELCSAGLLPVMYTRCLLTPVLAEMEGHGLQLDPDRVHEQYEKFHNEYVALEQEFLTFTGGINFNSPKQVANYLYDVLKFEEPCTKAGEPDRTDTGGRRTDADTVERLEAGTGDQREFKRLYTGLRLLAKSHETLGKMVECIANDGGILYGQFNQAVTQTHRLSSSGKKWKIQFQNINRDFKKLFKAIRTDWLIGEADGAQLEFRVAAHLGRDPVAATDIRSDFDAHRFTASILNKIPEDKVTKDQRQDAKPRTFKPLYGGRSGTPDERRYYKTFQEKYAGVFAAQTDWTYEVLRSGSLRTEWGFKFYWPGTQISRSGYIDNTTSIFNYPVQSFATADIIPIAVVYFWHRSRDRQLRLVNTIHDSVIVELPPEEEDAFRDLADHCFTRDVFDYLKRVYLVDFTVPLGTETKVGSHWSQGNDRKYNLDPATT